MIKVIETADGSYSLFSEELQETYHSINGAEQESLHVYIDNGLAKLSQSTEQIKILEIGFGAGLNALLSYEFILKQSPLSSLFYHAIEPYPLEEQVLSEYIKSFSDSRNSVIKEIHQSAWNEAVVLSDQFSIYKDMSQLQQFVPQGQYDLVFFDAFGPEAQPEMWEIEMLAKSVGSLKKNGLWLSYCAKGQVRRDLQSLGLAMERLEGPPGKREMLKGTRLA
ncbi:MAG: tRNA (5-methylaminomethyl-2-thiouridine)(34)-methyltransferase MnmD [Bacteroidia bacterium]